MKTLAEQVQSVRREIAMRERVYPKWIETKRLKPEQAVHERDCMDAVLETLLRIDRGELVPINTRAQAVDFVAGEPEIRRSERLKVLEVLARAVPSVTWIRAKAAIEREIGA